jgi:hypothetical protein
LTSTVAPPPPQEEDFEAKLSFVTLKDDNITMLLNDEPGYPVALPKYIAVKKKREDRIRIVEKKILDGCHMYYLDYVGEENLRNAAKEVVNLLYERENLAAAAAAATEEEQEQQHQPEKEQQQQQPTIELTPELTREITYEEIAVILSVSIKKDKPNKLITFNGMLLSQTNKDQFNVGFQAESAAGKSYIPYEISSYFPPNEVLKIASASPTAFYHKGGVWDEERKAQVCDLEHKIVIFSDQPHFQLLEKMRSVLSKDDKELTYWITDKSRSGANRTKTIIIRGFASFFFCTAKTDPDEQEKTRLILLSPETDEKKLYESLELAALRNADTDEYRKVIEQDPKRKWLIDRILAIRQLGIREIIIPDRGKPVFDRFIREHKHLIARHQRDLPRIFGFIKAHALLNCFNRERLTNGKSGTIVATDADIDAGFALYKEIEESNELGLSPYIYRIYKQVIQPNLNQDGLTRKDIRSKYFSVFHKFLHPKFEDAVIAQIEAAGLIQQEPDKEDRRKMLVLPSAAGGATTATATTQEQQKYIPQDSGYTPKKPDKIVQNQQSGEEVTAEVEKVEKIENFAPIPTVSGDISLAGSIKEITNKLIGDKGFFTKTEWMTTLMLLPIQDPLHCDENQAEQTLYQLLQEGKVLKLADDDKYQPITTEKLNHGENS